MSRSVRTLFCAVSLAAPALAQTNWRVSVGSGGVQGNNASSGSALSADGGVVVFTSGASNLVPGDTNGVSDVFVRDRFAGTTERVNVDSSGAEQIGGFPPSVTISGDGRWIAFESVATNLVPNDTNGNSDIFLRDRATNVTRRVSVDPSGLQADGDSFGQSLSGDGRWIAFNSRATNLVGGDLNGVYDVFVRDLQTQQNFLASVHTNGAQANGLSLAPSISADGSRVAFQSVAGNLDSGDFNGGNDIFVHDFTTGTTECASLNQLGYTANGDSSAPRLSANGNVVAYSSFAKNLVVGDVNLAMDVFIHDFTTGATNLVSITAAFGQANGRSDVAGISNDGRYVAFTSFASNLVVGDTNGKSDLFVVDRTNGAVQRISAAWNGAENDSDATRASMSSDGRVFAFDDASSTLVPGDTNAASDVFLHDRNFPEPTVYCTAKVNSLGCSPTIALSGAPSATGGPGALLATTQVLGAKTGLYFHSLLTPTQNPFHGGWLCVKAPTKRHPVSSSGGTAGSCSGTFTEDLNAYIAGGADPALVAGATLHLQHWSRDIAAPFGDSLSDAVTATIAP
ncbi:MAG: hypothetical protein K8S98_17905 [Planctomycetes bacterium]|nr:hypothetical protein [Planctomycetota bacterium]